METRNRLWPTLIAVGMLAYGGGVIWSVARRVYHVASFDWSLASFDWSVLVAAALFAGVGGTVLIFELLRQPDDERPHMLGSAYEAFAAAWRRLWGTKWLRWVYGSVAAVALASALVQAVLSYLIRNLRFPNGPPSGYSLSVAGWLGDMWFGLPNWSRGAIERLVPRISVNAPLVLAVAIVLVSILILPRLARLRREPECSGKVGFYTACLILLVCANVVTTAYTITETRRMLIELAPTSSAGVSSSGRGPVANAKGTVFTYPSGTFGGRRAQSRYPYDSEWIAVVGVVGETIFCAMMMGGLLGLLMRSRKGEGVNRGTFLSDSVRFFEPLAAIYLVFFLQQTLPFLLWRTPPLLHYVIYAACIVLAYVVVPLLMYAPVCAVSRNLGFGGAMRHSLDAWRSLFWPSVRLVAVGAFVYTLSRAFTMGIMLLHRGVTWLTMPTSALYALVGIAVQALITLAVWEFYQSNVGAPELVSETA